ncbi:MAG: chitosanase [Gammaproteobacteria bacterium]|nr:chitosanase [Gammaproteobacteria bacterium]NIR81996.1 chitosanase [Gammaproteobacteria bacterium]NIR89053.1 chitosanase [Gammaproteobacteria bacterium]NIU03103.1 chitosanase [Gammaproteobacteria bacterium]NIV50627.1 chitosanase [Gammaproteobacteria bacterium]
MLTEIQKRAAQGIVNIFETGRVRGDYAQVTLLAGDTGHLTYGRAQTTLASGNLYLLVKAYCQAPGAELAAELTRYLGALEARDVNLDHDMRLRALLRDAGHDPVMQEVQDGFFDRVYWRPAERAAAALGMEQALGVAVVYDSFIHGSWHRMRDRTVQRHGQVADIGEKAWVEGYVSVRREWLATHSNRLLHRTVYRMDALRQLMDEGRWALEPPFTCRGVRVDEHALLFEPSPRASSEEDEARMLRLQSPFMRGEDVRALQGALRDAGAEVDPDGVFGPATDAALRAYQARHGLSVDGIAGPATRSALGL